MKGYIRHSNTTTSSRSMTSRNSAAHRTSPWNGWRANLARSSAASFTLPLLGLAIANCYYFTFVDPPATTGPGPNIGHGILFVTALLNLPIILACWLGSHSSNGFANILTRYCVPSETSKDGWSSLCFLSALFATRRHNTRVSITSLTMWKLGFLHRPASNSN